MQGEFDDKLAQQDQSADVGQNNWLTNAQNALEERERILKAQWSNLKQESKATVMQNQMLTVLQAALSQIAPNSATGMQSESLSSPDPATPNPVRAVAAKNSKTPIIRASLIVASALQSSTVDQKREIKCETLPVKCATQESPNASQTSPTARRTEPQVARRSAARTEEYKLSSSKRSQPKKAKENSDPLPDDPDDSEPSHSDNDASRGGSSGSSDAESFSSEDEDIEMTTTMTTADGTTIWNCRPYMGYTNQKKFVEKASRDNRELDGHSDQRLVYAATQIYTSRLKTNATQIQEAVHWYYRFIFGKVLYDEDDRPRNPIFFYRLNAAATKAEVKFKSSSKLRESHIRRINKKLRNDQLKRALKGHRFQSTTDLERALCRHEDVWREEGYDSPAPKKPRDFRADNVYGRTQNRGPTRRQGRAFVTQGDTEPAQDSQFQHEPQNPEVVTEQAEAHSKSISEFRNGGTNGEVFRVAENQLWMSPNPHSGQGVARPENWDDFCEKCKKWGNVKPTVGPE
ncbi:LOW QUALITY PROTEIN: hypothetical protein PHMEG_00010830 [Phytophthora megakarya]|uniref:Uncharacterized protein n=1 Tax=Phytophthora megakarya TaxID=4795 RepID=A0A225WD91_9STRA|nr:LOW QUALITY PROTEIN: hypothetical protein PHMEG_00010830 [Phytophthora megakarya]